MHVPVLLSEIITKCGINNDFQGTILDCTFGAGGYTKEFINSSGCKVIGLDIDNSVEKYAKEIDPTRFQFHNINYKDYHKVLDGEQVDIIVFDLGCSTMQFKTPERGFSFMLDGGLNMRMGGDGLSAAQVVNDLPSYELMNIIRDYGEDRNYKRIVELIVDYRKKKYISSTRELAGLIEKGVGRYGKIHPATRVFQALRIYVNDELEILKNVLKDIHLSLKLGGYLCVVSFHSLEARIVKDYMISNKIKYNTNNKYIEKKVISGLYDLEKVVHPTFAEIKKNPSARSAQLRVAKRVK